MKYLLPISLLLTASCGYDIKCNYSFWAAGMTFCYQEMFDSTPSPQMIEEIIDDVETISRLYYSEVHDIRDILQRRNTVVYVVSGDIADCIDSPSAPFHICYRDYVGYNSLEDGLIVIEEPKTNNTCLLYSGFMHEILHTVDNEFFGGGSHDTPHFFMQNYNTVGEACDTIEWRLDRTLIAKLDNYPDNCR